MMGFEPRIGTAGWSVPSRYAEEVPGAGRHLARYAARLTAVEINSSFYRPHRRTTYARWAASVPAGFRFSVKLPRAITHERRLVDCVDLLDPFIDAVGGLGETLGVLLVQLPPSLGFDGGTAAAFFAALRERAACVLACEPRHRSWFGAEAEALLEAHGAVRVAADPPPVPEAARPGGWPGCVYLRLHGSPQIYASNYDEVALARIKASLDGHRAAGIPAWCIFDNTAASHALGNAMTLAAMEPGWTPLPSR